MAKVEIIESAAMSSVDYAWVWKVFLDKTKKGTFTLSCEHTYSPDGALRKISPTRGIVDGPELLRAVKRMWFDMTNDEIDESDLQHAVAKVNESFPELVASLGIAVDKLQKCTR